MEIRMESHLMEEADTGQNFFLFSTIFLPSFLSLLPPTPHMCVCMCFQILFYYVKVKATQSCPALCDPMDYTVHGILQARYCVQLPVLNSRSLFIHFLYQFNSVAQLCLTLCDLMDCSTPGFPVHHQVSELAQTRVH